VSPPRHHIVTAKVENKAGVLARVASLFSRRGFNIFSLAVAPTDNERFSRITIVVDVESAPLEQIMKQLDKLVNVVSITELAPEKAVEREMLLVTVEAGPAERGQVIELVGAFGGTIVDEGVGEGVGEGAGEGAAEGAAEGVAEGVAEGADRMTVMLAGTPGSIDDFENLVRPFGIIELQRTGLVALPKLEPGGAPGRGAAPLHSTAPLHSGTGALQGEAG
jgi:acetolactate synthase-1/3 small subunit